MPLTCLNPLQTRYLKTIGIRTRNSAECNFLPSAGLCFCGHNTNQLEGYNWSSINKYYLHAQIGCTAEQPVSLSHQGARHGLNQELRRQAKSTKLCYDMPGLLQKIACSNSWDLQSKYFMGKRHFQRNWCTRKKTILHRRSKKTGCPPLKVCQGFAKEIGSGCHKGLGKTGNQSPVIWAMKEYSVVRALTERSYMCQ